MKNTDVLVIGVGNTDRGDDGFGPQVADLLHEKKSAAINIKKIRGEGLELMDQWDGFDKVVVVDVVQSGNKPGKIHRFDATTTPLPKELFQTSTHGFGVAESIEMARSLDKLPKELIIYGVEGKNFSTGSDLSPEVKNALPNLVEKIEKETGEFYA